MIYIKKKYIYLFYFPPFKISGYIYIHGIYIWSVYILYMSVFTIYDFGPFEKFLKVVYICIYNKLTPPMTAKSLYISLNYSIKLSNCSSE